MRPWRWRSKRGNAMLEFALSAGILIPCLAGSFQFGYAFYTYNKLQSAIDQGGRYASMRTYRYLAGVTDEDKVKLAVKNVVVYGTPSPGANDAPVVNGLDASKVTVAYTKTSGFPTSVQVSISSFAVNTIFATYTFAGKPVVTFPFVGRYAAAESEP
jgi:Flp pilus assembly protein TadG